MIETCDLLTALSRMDGRYHEISVFADCLSPSAHLDVLAGSLVAADGRTYWFAVRKDHGAVQMRRSAPETAPTPEALDAAIAISASEHRLGAPRNDVGILLGDERDERMSHRIHIMELASHTHRWDAYDPDHWINWLKPALIPPRVCASPVSREVATARVVAAARALVRDPVDGDRVAALRAALDVLPPIIRWTHCPDPACGSPIYAATDTLGDTVTCPCGAVGRVVTARGYAIGLELVTR